MDAAYNFLKKIALFLVAPALLMATITYTGPTITVNPVFTNNTFQIGNSSCNDFQQFTLISSDQSHQIPITISVEYVSSTSPQLTDPTNGQWLYALALGGNGTPSSVNTVSGPTATINIPPAGTGATPNSLSLTIGLQRTFSSVTEQAFVLVHVVGDPSGQSDQLFTVNYAYNSGCNGNSGGETNGPIIITPSSLAMTAAQGNSQGQSVTVQNTTASPITFTAIPEAGAAWLTTNAQSTTTVAASGVTTVNVTANAAGLNATSYNGTIAFTFSNGTPLLVPVTFAVTTGSGGGGGTSSGSLTLDGGTLTTRNFDYIQGTNGTGVPGAVCVDIEDSNSSVTSYSYVVTVNSGGNWLTVNNSTSGSQTNQSFGGHCLQLNPNNSATSLASGAYSAVVTVTDTANATAAVNVNLYVSAGAAAGVSVTPGLIYNFPAVTTGATATESEQFTVTATSPITLGTAQQSSASWLTMTTPTGSGGGSETFTLTANPSGLPAAIYGATITIPSSNPAGSTSILVYLPVGQTTTGGGGTGTVTSTVLPTSLNFASEANNGNWTGGQEAQSVTITGAIGASWSSSVVYQNSSNSWLRFGGASGATGGTFGAGTTYCPANSTVCTLLVDIQPSGLAASSTPYTATITVATPSGNTPVSVSLLVTAAGTHVLLASPASTQFAYSGGTNPSQQVIFSDTSQGFPGTSGSTPVIGVTTSTPWLTATSIGNTMTLTANPSNEATGAYYGSVTVTSGSYPNTPLTYPVVLVVNGGTSTGPLTLNPAGFTFSATAGGNAPGTQSLTVSAQTSTSVSIAVSQGNCSGTWLFISPLSNFTAGTPGQGFTVSVSQGAIAAGTTCNGSISFTPSGLSAQVVNVSMTVSATSTTGNVTATPTSLAFTYTTGGANPGTQSLAIANAVTGTTGTPFTVSSSASWLTVDKTSAATPYSLTVTATPGSMVASSTPYTANLTISPTGGTAVIVPVTLTINGAPVVTATPTTLSFAYSVGSSNPATQTVAVSGGGAAATFSVTTSSSGWLSVTPTSGTTPNTGTLNLIVTANPTNLNPGTTYNGSITISGIGTATGTTIVNVSFAITAPLPTITGVTNVASYSTGAIAPGEIISIFANATSPIGPAVGVPLNSTTCPSPCTNLPTNMGGVQVEFLPSGVYAPLVYVSATQINCVVPYEVQGVGTLSVEVKYLGQPSNAYVLQAAATSPGIFTANSSGTGPAAMVQYDAGGNFQGFNSVGNPASPGWYLTFYVTGEGSIPSPVTGKVTSSVVLPLLGPPTVTIDGQPATVTYYAEAAGYVSGLMQVNVQIPTGIHTSQGDSLVLKIGGNSSQAGVTVLIK